MEEPGWALCAPSYILQLGGERLHFAPTGDVRGRTDWLQNKVRYSNPAGMWWRHGSLFQSAVVWGRALLLPAERHHSTNMIQFKITVHLKTQVWDCWLKIICQRAQVNRRGFTRATGTKHHHFCFFPLTLRKSMAIQALLSCQAMPGVVWGRKHFSFSAAHISDCRQHKRGKRCHAFTGWSPLAVNTERQAGAL